ncbi:hypothetical protein D3C72_1828630 [compost metagenome]
MRQHQHGRAHQLGTQCTQHLGRHQALGHAGGRRGRQRIDMDVVLGAFERQGLHQADQGHLGRAIVALPKIAEQAR